MCFEVVLDLQKRNLISETFFVIDDVVNKDVTILRQLLH